jgi:hypothetical protein
LSYIGNPIVSTDFPKDTFSGNGSTTAFTMSIAPASVNSVIVVVSGITQDPSTYTISGTTLTFSAAPPTGTSNISVRHLGVAGTPQVPATGSVVNASMSTGAPYWDTSGNVGIGSTSTDPFSSVNTKMVSIASSGGGTSSALNITSGAGSRIQLGIGTTRTALLYSDSANYTALQTTTALPLVFGTNDTERMRITSAGELLWGCTATSGSVPTTSGIAFAATASAYDNALYFRNGADPTYVLDFYNTAGSRAGKVTVNSSTTSYDTSSDYRLKENVEPMVNALSTVAQLKPVTYTWKSTGEDGQGFIAHELQAIVPDAVTGVKDGIDAHGNPDYQGVDASFLIATLTAAIQEQQAMIQTQQAAIEELTTRVTALETV